MADARNKADPLSALLEASEPSMMMDVSGVYYDEGSRMDIDVGEVLNEQSDEEKWRTVSVSEFWFLSICWFLEAEPPLLPRLSSASPRLLTPLLPPQIETWLRQFYPPPAPLPPFEKTPETLRRIYRLYLMHRQREETTRICVAEMKRETEEYRDQGASRRLREMHEAIGIRREDLSKQGETAVQTLASIACTLGLRDVKLSSYQRAITDLTINSAELEMERDRIARVTKTIESRSTEARAKLEQLQKWVCFSCGRLLQSDEGFTRVGNALFTWPALLTQPSSRHSRSALARAREARDTTELDTIREQRANTQVLNSKAQEYVKTLERVEQQYAATGIEQCGLGYPALRAVEEEIGRIERELVAKQKVLAGYRDVPPVGLGSFTCCELLRVPVCGEGWMD
ncbi:hypothetical protein BC936DRAFT_143501 [Jimgerdemannia flammicorona]|uniref:Uncharacterized protein n=1 Tax=Jimgerdemannia flammicorona TaxID=994334 RepID=A0A432ZYT3_9FUNG|nr:hypothetical protein BC936DRAFT_143501 [Jimgerdemannia flammicorona]